MSKRPIQFLLAACAMAALVLLLTTQLAPSRTAPVQAAVDQSTYLPLLGNQSVPLSNYELFGVQMYGSTGPGGRYFEQLSDLDNRTIRVNVFWRSAEPINTSPENFQWSETDSRLAGALAENGGYTIIATVEDAPEWAAPKPDGPLYPDNPAQNLYAYDEMAEFMAALVERYDGDGKDDAPGNPVVRYWEMYNEPDATNTGALAVARWGEFGAEYAHMLSKVYPAVKSASPKAQVVFGGIAYDWFEEAGGPFVRSFFDDVMVAGGGAFFDIMCLHSYRAFSSDWTDNEGVALLEKTKVLRDKLFLYGYRNKPFFVTEAGWHSGPDSSHASQSSHVVQLFTQAKAADISMLTWWTMWDIQGYPFDNGLVTADGEKKPAFLAYQEMVEQLVTAEFVRTWNVGETGDRRIEVHQFDDPAKDRQLYVLWFNPAWSDGSRPIKIRASSARVIDMYGAAFTVSDGADGVADGMVTVTAGAAPIYVEVK